MIWLFFIKILCLDIKIAKVISLKQNEEIQLFEVENDKLRLRLNKDKSFKVGDKNVITLETNGDLFLIKFSSGKYLFKIKQNNIVVDEIKAFALNNLDPIQGFKWDIKETEHGFKIESDGVCLEKSSSTGIANEFFVDAKDCSDTPNQNFSFIDISSTDMALEKNVQNEYIQKEGPTINPIIHGINNKRDPYMYGNEPFRGKHHKLECALILG